MSDVLFKAELIICGLDDNNVYDFHEIYALVAYLNDVKVILSVAVELGLQVQHTDVSTAFLYRELEKTIYMKIPEGIETVKVMYVNCINLCTNYEYLRKNGM